MKLQTWLGEAHPQARMIGVYGMAGVGKTLLLNLVYNHYKEVSGPFDVIIWPTVSMVYRIEELQASIAETLKLRLEGSSDNDLRKMKLSESLGKQKFLLILDDLWRPIDLIELGVKFGDHNCSKVLVSSRSREVIFAMEASKDYTLKIQLLSLEEGWKLFRTITFRDRIVPDDIEATAREIASQCQGLPLALNAVGAAMMSNETADEWRLAFSLMISADPSFQFRYSTIDRKLYQKLKWSYDDLPNRELKICFLYCAVFPENAEIPVETLVEMWSAEKLVSRMDVGHKYIDVLVDRGLFEYVAAGYETIKTLHGQVRRYVEKRVRVHNVLRQLAIYIGQIEEKWFFATGQQLQNFPREDGIRDCKRISVGHNDIQDLPTYLICSKLVSLVLANNEGIREVPEIFLSTAVSLKILDLSGTLITSLPTSLGQLGQLEFLKLTGCYLLENLPESIGNLSHLRFLNLEYCQSLNCLPNSIGELRNLKRLSLESCESLMVIPHAISRLTSLNKLFLPLRGGRKSWATSVKNFANLSYLKELAAKNVEDFANLSNLMELAATTSVEDFANPSNLMELAAISVEDFANLSNLMELTAVVKEEIKESTMTTWTNLRRLEVWFYYNADRDDVVEDIFPFNMETLTKLEHFELHFCERVSLPNCISQFKNLTTLYLSCCPHLRELPACEIGNEIVGGGFPMLKRLELENLNELESMVGSSVVSSEEIMPGLEEIRITDCRSLKRLGTKKFLRLKRLSISGCEEFEALEIESAGLPMLEDLQLFFLEKCEIIVGPSGVINDEVMPELKVLKVHYCGLLKLGLEKLPNLRSISIIGCEKLRGLPLEMGSDGFPVLERLSLWDCANLENIVGSLDVWNDKTMPNLKLLDIRRCSLLRRLPTGIENLSNLHQIIGGVVWWQKLFCEDKKVKSNIFRLFTDYRKLTL
jgi:Leucine-rich repeat (LRR) protein